ncbi:MAG: coenzyme F420-0:L-glutamate ligase [Gammaproteobacteria bacterium]|nr:MAG: coenzyme F420-0:L-glutamate ligase [Gammaproteobacteria bacterium]
MELTFSALNNIPMVAPKDNVAEIIMTAAKAQQINIVEHDVIVIAQKIISKAENRYVVLEDVTPSEEAIQLAQEVQKDPRYVEVVLQESAQVVRKKTGVLIVEHQLGFVHANAGLDQSNIEHPEQKERVLLLPKDPDLSAKQIRQAIHSQLGINVAVIINDSMGRAWRNGTLGLAIGVAGLTALEDYMGGHDIFGRELKVTAVAAADELAAGASLVMGQTHEKTPIVIVRGYRPQQPADANQQGIAPLLRSKDQDLFR